MSHLHARHPICPRVLANKICRGSCSADPGDKGCFHKSRSATGVPATCLQRACGRIRLVVNAAGSGRVAKTESFAPSHQPLQKRAGQEKRRCNVVDARPPKSGVRGCRIEFLSVFMPRVRHCMECPKCGTRYLPSSSPYRNGSYLIPLSVKSATGWILYCVCGVPPVSSQWGCTELRPYGISCQAYRRGYGSADEIWAMNSRGDTAASALGFRSHQ